MSTVTVENMGRFTYTATVDNKDSYGTLTFTISSFEVLNPSKYKRKKGYWAGIKIDGKNLVGSTAEKVPSVKYSKSTSKGVSVSSGQLGVVDDSTIYVDNSNDYKIWKKETAKTLQNHLWANLYLLQDKINKKISQNKNKKTIKVTGNQRSISITFQIYGYIETVSFNVGGTSPSSGSSAKEEGVEYTSITSVNNGIPYLIKQESYKTYGWIERVVDFNDIDDPTVLKRVGQLYLDNLQFNDMSIEVTALDLHYIDNTIQRLDLLDSVRCISKPHGLDKVFPITKVTIPLDHPDQVKYTLGTNQSGGGGISASSSKDAKKFMKSLEAFPTKAYTLDTAKAYSSTILNQRTTGYVTIVDRSENDQTHSEAIIISSGTDWTTSQRIWKWDMNGLGYSDKKISEMSDTEKTAMQTLTNAGKAVRANDDDRWYKLGITNDGAIVADVIKTGLLSDARGLNQWDMTTGAFNLTGLTTVVDTTTNKKTSLNTINSKSEQANVVANDAMLKANSANAKQYGYTNYLKGTSSPVLVPDSSTNQSNSYTNGNWLTYGKANSKPSVHSDNKLPSGVKKYIKLPARSSIKQFGIPLEPSQSYTVSCKAKYINTGSGNRTTNLTIEVYQKNNGNIKMTPKTTKLTNKYVTYSANFKVPNSNSDTVDYVVSFSNSSDYDLSICALKLEKGNMATDWTEQNVVSSESIYEDMVKYVDLYGKTKAEATLATLTQADIIERITGKKAGNQPNGMWLSGGKLYISAESIRSGTIISDNSKSYWNLKTGTFQSINAILTGKTENIEVDAGTVYHPRNKKHTKYYAYSFDRIVDIQKGLCVFRAKYVNKGKNVTINAGSIGVESIGTIYNDDMSLEIVGKQALTITTPQIIIRSKASDKNEEYAESKTVKVLSSDKKHTITLKFVNGIYVGDESVAKGRLR